MNKIMKMSKEQEEAIVLGTKCYHCKYIKAIKLDSKGEATGEILCDKQNKMIKNNWSYCNEKEEIFPEEIFQVGDVVKTKDALQVGKRYKGILFREEMKLESAKIENIDRLFNKNVYMIQGFSYSGIMLEKANE